MKDPYNGHYLDRRDRIIDLQERAARNLKERYHRIDEDKYNYKRFRKGPEIVEAYWLDSGPHHRYGSRYWANYDHRYSRYPVPPPGGWPDRDYWNHGDREAPWRKERGFW